MVKSKGISELQRELLVLAFKNLGRVDSVKGKAMPHLTIREAMRGRTPYRVARVAVIKSFKRIEARGLMKLMRQPSNRRWFPKNSEGGYIWLGVDLTESGKKIAEEISRGY